MRQFLFLFVFILFCGCSEKNIYSVDNEPFDFGELFNHSIQTYDSKENITSIVVTSEYGGYVATSSKVFKIQNNNRLNLLKDFGKTISDMLLRNDTLFVFTEKIVNSAGEELATGCEYFIRDHFHPMAKWEKDSVGLYKNLVKKIGYTISPEGVVYRIKHNTKKLNNEDKIHPSTIERYVNDKWEIVKLLPSNMAKYLMNNIYINSQGLILIPVIAGTFDTNDFFVPDTSPRGLILIMQHK